ncbi:MAG: S-layer homology domain-containing protein [Clostridia bacterium]|nr:S-layer homology domain-containing protein [Clostridia bacterium]
MKKIISLALAALVLLAAVPLAYAAEDDIMLISEGADNTLLIAPNPNASKTVTAKEAADALHALGLLAGVGVNADGSVNFNIDGSLTRAQSITQVVRFLGAEKAATSETNAHPFIDLAAWAVPYISYAYANGITAGVSATKFDPDSAMSDYAFLTAILRVLGYSDANGDFAWNNPYALAKEAGLIVSETPDGSFTRGDAFIICYNALTAAVKSGDSIKDQLIAKGLFTEAQFNEVMGISTEEPLIPEVPANPVTELVAIQNLEQKSENGDHANDDISTASLEINYRETVELSSATTGQSRYDNAWYPRIKKVNDDLYILFWMYGQLGRHLYVAYSNDGYTWSDPEVFWGATSDKKITHTYGPLAGKEDQMLAVNADACVLDNGDILCVYAVRPSSGYGYADYIEMNGIFMRRGTVGADNKVTWSDEVQLTKGQVWEPFIFQRDDGQIEIYWSCAVAYIDLYGMDKDKRSTCTSMIYSTDNGDTWSPETNADSNYVGMRVYQEYIGDKIPYGTNEDGTPMYTEAVPYFGGQMPSATELYNGKTLLALEVNEINGSDFHISLATSGEGGEWKNLGLLETNPEGANIDPFDHDGAGPYLATFESGEVYLTYNLNAAMRGRLISPDGTTIDKEFRPAPDAKGSWGATEVLNSHRVASTFPKSGDARSIYIYYSYLNHRVNAPKVAINVDGYTNDWTDNTDAIFVGSETQAQITVRTAHDNDNVYFLISRLDTYITDGDTATICIGAGTSNYYRVIVGLDGVQSISYVEGGSVKSTVTGGNAVVKVLGTVGNNEDKDEGVVTEVSIPKALVGLSGASSFAINPSLSNRDGSGSTNDTLTGVSTFTTTRWPSVVLD